MRAELTHYYPNALRGLIVQPEGERPPLFPNELLEIFSYNRPPTINSLSFDYRRLSKTIITALIAAFTATSAPAAINVTIEEIGAAVVAAYSGNITGSLGTPDRTLPGGIDSIWPGSGRLSANDRASLDFYFEPLATNLLSFGTGTEVNSQTGSVSATGDRFALGVVNISGRNYRSLAFDQNFNGGSFNGSVTISNATLDSLGIDSDFGTFSTTYDFSPQGGNATGSFQFTVVPEPSAYAALLGLTALASVGLRRRRR